MATSVHDGLVAGEHVLLIAVDTSQAFDRMVKGRLYEKMEGLGIPPVAVRWMRAFLTDRQACVRVGGATSSYHAMEEGCPQGTVAGPLAWDIFIDDIVPALACAGAEVSLYADDTAIVLRGRDVDDLYRRGQRTVDGLRKWAVDNGVLITVGEAGKTSTTHFAPPGEEAPARPGLRYCK